ncbi:MAG TPA: hypothetical protein VEX68_28095 [Bryobacteraceae bacterium]|nr:hypothetical protein [Bryobacteraceae bacterium]
MTEIAEDEGIGRTLAQVRQLWAETTAKYLIPGSGDGKVYTTFWLDL